MAITQLSAAHIAGRALRLVGAWGLSETEPRTWDVKEAVASLDEMCSHLGETVELPWLRKIYTIDLVNDPQTLTYDLAAATQVGTLPDTTQIAHWRYATLINADSDTDERTPLDVLFEADWIKRWCGLETGVPERVWIERRLTPIMHVIPAPDPTTETAYQIELVGMQSAVDLKGDDGMGRVKIEVPNSWALFLRYELASILGEGAVSRVSAQAYQRIRVRAAQLKAELIGNSVIEHKGQLLAQSWGID